MDRIILPHIPVMGRHGVFDWERMAPQPFSIRVEIGLDTQPAATSDDVADTIDYGMLYQKIKLFAENNTFCLLEKLADQIANIVLCEEKAEWVKVCVEKCQAKCANGAVFSAMVEVERCR